MIETTNPRQLARSAMRESVPTDLWTKNEKFIADLRSNLNRHPVAGHPAISALNQGCFSQEQMKRIHLEYRHSIVQIFTDALLIAQYQTRQLEPYLQPGSKMYARFLITLNDLDEFGFQPGADDKNSYYRGNPLIAHYPLFERVLDDLNISLEERQSYVPSSISQRLRTFFEDNYADLVSVTSLLAVAEKEVVLFSAPLRENIKSVGIDVTQGYYVCHGTSDDAQATANDDTHEDDLWYVLMQAIKPAQYDDISNLCREYNDLWVEFWDTQLNLLAQVPEKQPALMM